MRRALRLIACVLVIQLVAGCTGAVDFSGEDDSPGQIDYWLWDANQLPAYQACADAFHAKHPDITVKITQYGWDDYWNTLTNGFLSGTAPDVFTNHLSRYPELAGKGQLVPLDEYVRADNFDTSIYQPGLAEMWVGQEGNRFGLPKDWDAIGLFYNKAMLADAGIDESELANLEWNPEDGGSYEEMIAALTVDANGVRGNEPGFDKQNVEVYGLGLEDAGSAAGQGSWSMYAGSNDWTYTNRETWGDEYYYGDPRLAEAISWWRGLITKGFMPPLEASAADAGVGMPEQFAAGTFALTTQGSWMVSAFADLEGVETGVAPVPVGPDGERASMSNSLADSIWTGSPTPDDAWKWVSFLGSPECQDIVAEHAVVFPAVRSSMPIAEDAFAAKGIELGPFSVNIEEGTTINYPITDNASAIDAVMAPTMDAIMSFNGEVAPTLEQANEDVNALFGG